MSRKRHLNRWIGGAYLVRDPELRTTDGGKSVCVMRIGVHGAGKDYGDGYFDLVVWDDAAKNCAKYLQAGSEIDVEARLHFHAFERGDGSKGSEVSLMADRVTFAGGGNGRRSGVADAERAEEEAARRRHDDVPLPAGATDEDIPF